jgi:molecular chaperone GrpE
MMPRESESGDPRHRGQEELAAEPADKQITDAVLKAEEYLNNWKRTQADFTNYKRRAEQEKLEMGKFANAQLILTLLPVLDDFERAFENIKQDANKEWLTGIRLVESKLRSILEANGLKPIEVLGKHFDPALHEGVMHGRGAEGIIVAEMRKGYMLHDKVLRASQVVVGNGEE